MYAFPHLPSSGTTAEDFDRLYGSQSLLQVMLTGAIVSTVEGLQQAGRKNRSQSLHPLATLAMFIGTKGALSETELLDLVDPDSDSEEHDVARQLRGNLNRLRGRKPRFLHEQAQNLLKTRKLGNAEVVKGWVNALIHAAALQIIHSMSESEKADVLEKYPLADRWVDGSFDALMSLMDSYMVVAQGTLKRGDIMDYFLQSSASTVISLIGATGGPFSTLGTLVNRLYPDLDGLDPFEVGHAETVWHLWATEIAYRAERERQALEAKLSRSRRAPAALYAALADERAVLLLMLHHVASQRTG